MENLMLENESQMSAILCYYLGTRRAHLSSYTWIATDRQGQKQCSQKPKHLPVTQSSPAVANKRTKLNQIKKCATTVMGCGELPFNRHLYQSIDPRKCISLWERDGATNIPVNLTEVSVSALCVNLHPASVEGLACHESGDHQSSRAPGCQVW